MVHGWIAASMICVHYNSLKPILTEENKWARIEMFLHFRDPDDPTKFEDMLDQIHVDEKWFFLTQERKDTSSCPRTKTQSIASNINPTSLTKDKLERNGKLLDVMDVVEEVAHLFDINDIDNETNNNNDKANNTDDESVDEN